MYIGSYNLFHST